MIFQIGDATDTALCIAIKHEFLRCEDAFKEFASAGTAMVMQGENRRIAYTAYNAYARFVHHLYEFIAALSTFAADTKMDSRCIQDSLKNRLFKGVYESFASHDR